MAKVNSHDIHGGQMNPYTSWFVELRQPNLYYHGTMLWSGVPLGSELEITTVPHIY